MLRTAFLHRQHNFNVYRCCLSVFVLLINTASPHLIVKGIEGESVILECVHKHVEVAEQQLEVHWRHNDIRNVYDIMHGKISVKEQHSEYKNRVSVVLEKCKTGNFSLKLENLQRSDEGTYLCFVPAVDVFQNVELVVKGRIAVTAKSFQQYRAGRLRSQSTDTRLGLILHLIPVFGFITHII
ncbi:CD276 antigen homolog [Triplophysa rosa]|uniref:Coxsackievirus and adenovirus receptor-like n=1 Tax=Triplophysa rosa TaxID=992332 RepID=A0A9W7T775_TRIRA|nr:CD276 antigen homolog [Triplophysa rosa]KAI7790867.1 Coxsackievirus and adenovirus receptor-like precursor [Triplophysa rosa]